MEVDDVATSEHKQSPQEAPAGPSLSTPTDQGEEIPRTGHGDASAYAASNSSSHSSKAKPAKGEHASNDKSRHKGKGKARHDQNAQEGSEPSLLEKLAQSPYSRELHEAHIAAAVTDDERQEARTFMAQMMPLSEQLWLEWIYDRKTLVGSTLEGKVEVLELYKRACSDVLSIKLHQEYARFVLAIYFHARGYAYPQILDEEDLDEEQSMVDESAAAVFDEDFVDGEMLSAVNQTIRWHLPDGQSVWLLLHSYRRFHLRNHPTAENIDKVERLYLERLCEPHLQLADTFQLFSSFVSRYKNTSYEESLVNAQPLYNATKAVVDLREGQEDMLAACQNSVDGFQGYLAWEQEVPKPDFPLVRALFERAIAAHSTEADIWTAYLAFLTLAVKKPGVLSGVAEAEWSADDLPEVYERAVRYLPFSSEVIPECIRGMESLYSNEVVTAFSEAQHQRVTEIGDPRLDVSSLVGIVTACADVLRHQEMTLEDDSRPTEGLVKVLRGGISKIKDIAPESGDPHLRLEKYLLRQFERKEDWIAMDALLASLAQSYPTSAAVLLTRAEHFLRQNKIDTVRKLYQNAAKKRYDYPEFVFDAWANFEHRDGSAATLEKALTTIAHEMKHVHARRLRESRLQQAAAEAPRETVPSEQIEDERSANGETFSKKRRLDVDHPVASMPATQGASDHLEQTEETSGTRFLRTLGSVMADARRIDFAAAIEVRDLKRDRENSTISVTGLSKDAKEEDIRKLFRDCGPIREVKVKELIDQAVATVEFNTRESLPAALTKDKKRIDGQEVQVSPVWQSTLYVTNFPEKFDAADIQQLFEPYGAIFETRWPSRRLKSTRRFVYIQYVDASAAQRALSLHDNVLEEGSGQRLQVRISDPSHRQKRSDANATKRELYVTGLPKQATEADLEKLFGPFGALRGCRILKDEAGLCRGAGFVDFETEQSASAALSMNNHEFRKRRLAVVLADSRISQKPKPTASGQGQRTDARSRSVKVLGLPSSVQEPLLQQFFDRFGRTSSVELHGSTAVVTFEDPADSAKLLLASSTLDYEGVELTIKEDVDRPARNHGGHKMEQDGPSRAAAFMPRTNRGRGRKLGIGASRNAHRMDVDAAPEAAPTASSTTADAAGVSSIQPPRRKQADFKAMLLGGPAS